jgi:hypothetical protein
MVAAEVTAVALVSVALISNTSCGICAGPHQHGEDEDELAITTAQEGALEQRWKTNELVSFEESFWWM